MTLTRSSVSDWDVAEESQARMPKLQEVREGWHLDNWQRTRHQARPTPDFTF